MKGMKGGERNGRDCRERVSGFVFAGPLQSLDTKVAASEQTDHHSDV